MAAGIIEIWASSSSKECIADLVFTQKKEKELSFVEKIWERERNQVFQISFYPEKDKKKRIGFCRWWDLRELENTKLQISFLYRRKTKEKKNWVLEKRVEKERQR